MKRYTGLIIMSLLLTGLLVGIDVCQERYGAEAQMTEVLAEKENRTARHAPVYTVFSSDDGTFHIEGWEDENGQLYLFLPGWMETQEEITVFAGEDLTVDGSMIPEGGSFILRERQTAVKRGEKDTVLHIMVSSALPVLWLETEDKSLEEIDRSKESVGRVRAYMLNADFQGVNAVGNAVTPQLAKEPKIERGGGNWLYSPKGKCVF